VSVQIKILNEKIAGGKMAGSLVDLIFIGWCFFRRCFISLHKPLCAKQWDTDNEIFGVNMLANNSLGEKTHKLCDRIEQ
jgi:hypothetical protein